MKIAVNKCYGGFGISVEALKELAMRGAKCIERTSTKKYYGGEMDNVHKQQGWKKKWEEDFAKHIPIGDGFTAHQDLSLGYNIHKENYLYSLKWGCDRADKDLIEVIEKLGRRASGRYAQLEIVEIPDDIEWEIDEYDGIETIHEKHRSW